MRERQREREIDRERGIGDFDSRNSPQQNFSTEHMSVVQVDISLQGRNRTLVPDFPILLGVTIEMWP